MRCPDDDSMVLVLPTTATTSGPPSVATAFSTASVIDEKADTAEVDPHPCRFKAATTSMLNLLFIILLRCVDVLRASIRSGNVVAAGAAEAWFWLR